MANHCISARADTIPGQTDGASTTWPLATVQTTPLPEQYFYGALTTPSSMTAPTNGFAFSINGSAVTWAFGPVLDAVSAPTVRFFCTPDQTRMFSVDITSGSATVPADCASANPYWYFFRYEMNNPGAGRYVMDDDDSFDPSSAYVYTALYIQRWYSYRPR